MTVSWGTGIPDEAHLRTLPDGTIISWLRIIGDNTSEAVAFVRREVTNESGFPTVDVWISPGGWDPQTIESAGVTFPAHVVRLGEFNPEHYLGAEIPLLTETLASGVLDSGGTWARAFEAYLDPEPDAVDPDDEPELDQAPSLGEMADVLRGWQNVGVTRESLNYAIERVFL